MSQQINLYVPVYRPQKKYFSSQMMLYAGGALFAGVVALSAFAQLRVYAMEKEAAQVSRLLMTRIEALQAAAADKSGETKRKSLESRVQSAEAELRSAQRIAEAIESSAGSDSGGFSEFLRALARQTVSGVWLTAINVDLEGDGLSLAGAALRPELVSDYIDRLRREEIFRGRSFAKVEIAAPPAPAAAGKSEEAAKAPSQRVEFRLISKVAEEPVPAQ